MIWLWFGHKLFLLFPAQIYVLWLRNRPKVFQQQRYTRLEIF